MHHTKFCQICSIFENSGFSRISKFFFYYIISVSKDIFRGPQNFVLTRTDCTVTYFEKPLFFIINWDTPCRGCFVPGVDVWRWVVKNWWRHLCLSWGMLRNELVHWVWRVTSEKFSTCTNQTLTLCLSVIFRKISLLVVSRVCVGLFELACCLTCGVIFVNTADRGLGGSICYRDEWTVRIEVLLQYQRGQ